MLHPSFAPSWPWPAGRIGGASDKDELDSHRFVHFFGHDFSPTTRFNSEVEIEHAIVEGGKGAVELE